MEKKHFCGLQEEISVEDYPCSCDPPLFPSEDVCLLLQHIIYWTVKKTVKL